jgi:hypothetical protein
MVKKALSIKTLKDRVKEETATSKMYRREGFIKQANQEMQHAKFFASQLKKNKK